MNREEAFSVLGLETTASEREIKDAFRALVRNAHPDGDGNPRDFDLLIEARGIALPRDPRSQELVPVADVKELIAMATSTVGKAEFKQAQREQTASIVRRTVRIRTSRLRQLRRTLSFAALIIAVSAGGTQLLRLQSDKDSTTWSNVLAIVLGFFAAVAAVFAAVQTQRISMVQESIQDLSDALGDKGMTVLVMTTVLNAAKRTVPFSPEDFYSALEFWHRLGSTTDGAEIYRDPAIARYLRRMGVREFGQLVISKAKELGVVVENEVWNGNDLEISFSFERAPRA